MSVEAIQAGVVPDDRAAGAVADPRQRRMILIAMCTALIAVIASVSGLNVAQQQLAADLGATQSQLLWVINGYTIALAALLLPVGAIGDRWGRKHVLLGGLGVFAVANVLASMATNPEQLIAFRVLAGVGAAMIMPVTLSVITSSFPPEDRGRAVGVWAGVAGAGGILGLISSAILVDNFTWPWLFAGPVALALVAAAMTVRFVPHSREHHAGRFDLVGSVLSAVAVGALVLGIHEGPEHGWSSPLAVASLLVGILAAAAFIVVELRHSNPLFDIKMFRNRSLAAGSLNLFLVFAVMFGIFLVLIQFLQAVLGFSALKASAGLLPMAAMMMPLSSVAPTLAKKFGTARVLIIGTLIFGTGLVMLATMVSVEGGYLSLLPGLMVFGVGVGLLMSPSTAAITEALPAEKQGVASALNDTVRELGGAVGIALLGSLINSGYRSSVSPATEGLSPELAAQVEDGIGSALAAGPKLGADGPAILDAAREALVEGWKHSMWFGVGLAAVGLVFLIVRMPRGDDGVDSGSDVAVDATDQLEPANA
jgi:EmrB/QacA subfamily drug resistance transporter